MRNISENGIFSLIEKNLMTGITLIELATIFNLKKLFICQNMHNNRISEYFSLFF